MVDSAGSYTNKAPKYISHKTFHRCTKSYIKF